MTVVIFLIVLAVLIFVHELGHFVAARACGIRVDAFALGFGPKLFSWKGKRKDGTPGETTYALNIIPFGGYVKIHGENPDEESVSGPDASRSFANKPRWQQAIVLAAGVLCNFVFAAILYTAAFSSGVTATTDGFERYSADFSDPRIMITFVAPGSPAEKAGLQAGDVLKQVAPAHTAPAHQTIADIQKTIHESKGASLDFTYEHGKQGVKTIAITPMTGLVAGEYATGIAMNDVADLRLPFFTAVYEGVRYTGGMIKETALSLYGFVADIFRGTADFSEVSGPVGIAGIVGNAATLGLTYLIMITSLISINLGIINLIPFPALDGGRILFVAIEGAIRKRISMKFTNAVNTVGFILLMILMVLVTYKDVAKLVK